MNLSFKLGSIPVRVDPFFFFVAAVLGWRRDDPGSLLIWIPVVFVGVLLHELGHALVGRSFGLTPRIDLVGMGGLTSWTGGDPRKVGAGKRIAISLAGPFTGIAIGLGFRLLLSGTAPLPPRWTQLIETIVLVNLTWGFINLLPILPMDGGNVLFQALNWLTKGQGEKPARIVSTALAAAIGLFCLFVLRQTYPALLAGLFAVQNIQALRAGSARENDAPLRALLKSGFDALEQGDPAVPVRIAKDVLSRANDPAIRSDAIRLLAFGFLVARAWGDLTALMESPASAAIGDDEMAKFEQAARELGGPAEAARIGAVRAQRQAPRL